MFHMELTHTVPLTAESASAGMESRMCSKLPAFWWT
jgi:hypothetical protein